MQHVLKAVGPPGFFLHLDIKSHHILFFKLSFFYIPQGGAVKREGCLKFSETEVKPLWQ